MDLSKSYDVFKPIDDTIHIVGCGSVGSTIAELLARLGLSNITLWDMDIVEPKNIANQMFFDSQIGHPKVEAVREIILSVNPEAKDGITLKPKGWNGETIRGYVFMAVDNIEIRKKFMAANKYNPHIKAIFDIRTGLYDAQVWAAKWADRDSVDNLVNSMNFTHDEAKEDTPVSACGEVLGVAPTVRFICTLAVTNFMLFVKEGRLKQFTVADPFHLDNDGIVTSL